MQCFSVKLPKSIRWGKEEGQKSEFINEREIPPNSEQDQYDETDPYPNRPNLCESLQSFDLRSIHRLKQEITRQPIKQQIGCAVEERDGQEQYQQSIETQGLRPMAV